MALKVVQNNIDYPDYRLVKQVFENSFLQSNYEINNNLGYDTRFSGSTCVSLLTFGKKLYVANVGDSRGIVIK